MSAELNWQVTMVRENGEVVLVKDGLTMKEARNLAKRTSLQRPEGITTVYAADVDGKWEDEYTVR